MIDKPGRVAESNANVLCHLEQLRISVTKPQKFRCKTSSDRRSIRSRAEIAIVQISYSYSSRDFGGKDSAADGWRRHQHQEQSSLRWTNHHTRQPFAAFVPFDKKGRPAPRTTCRLRNSCQADCALADLLHPEKQSDLVIERADSSI